VSSELVREGSYWPFARLPARIGDIGQGPSTVFAAVPGGTCTHGSCAALLSLTAGCAAHAGPNDPCVLGEIDWQSAAGDEESLAGPVVELDRGVTGHVRRGGDYLEDVSIAFASSGVIEVTLRSGREAHLVTLANALVDAGF
jgi:hypothetical protein